MTDTPIAQPNTLKQHFVYPGENQTLCNKSISGEVISRDAHTFKAAAKAAETKPRTADQPIESHCRACYNRLKMRENTRIPVMLDSKHLRGLSDFLFHEALMQNRPRELREMAVVVLYEIADAIEQLGKL